MTQNLLFASICAFSITAAAHQGHHHHHDHDQDPAKEAREIELSGISERELKELMDSAHHALESNDLTYWEKVKEKANFKKIFLSAYRWASQNEDRPEMANARANIATILLTSHLIETLGGGGMFSYGISNNLETWWDKTMTVIGAVIPIPGLDPLCIVLVGTYMAFPHTFNRVLTKPRVFVLKGARALNAMAHLPNGWVDSAYRAVSKTRFLQRYLAAGDVYSHRVMFGEFHFQIHGAQPGQFIELTMVRRPGGHLALSKVRFSEKARAMVRAYMAQLLAPFGMNIKSLVLEIDQAIADRNFEELRRKNYVADVDPLADRYTVTLKPGAFPFHNLMESDFSCEALLMEKRASRI